MLYYKIGDMIKEYEGFSLETEIERLFGRVCFYRKGGSVVRNRKVSGKHKNLLYLKNVNPRNSKQAERCIASLINYSTKLEKKLSNIPLLYRTHKEPCQKSF